MTNAALVTRYAPDFVITRDVENLAPALTHYVQEELLHGCTVLRSLKAAEPIHADLGLLLSTSGSTGNPKLVRLSTAAVAASAEQIQSTLDIIPQDRAVTSLPLAFVYGLGILNSHLGAGAGIVVTKRSILDQLFWKALAHTGVTSFAGVPWTYRVLQGIGFENVRAPKLRKLTSSGGSLDAQTRSWLIDIAERTGIAFYSMYGQTETCGRISVLPPSRFALHSNSVGVPVPGGAFRCTETGEIFYTGPNVMLGYAENRQDLLLGDFCRGEINTGDIGHLDGSGALTITGRASRFCKLFGLRINLDDIETELGGDAAVVSDDQTLAVVVEASSAQSPSLSEWAARLAGVAAKLGLAPQQIALRQMDRLPRSASGKFLYGEIASDVFCGTG